MERRGSIATPPFSGELARPWTATGARDREQARRLNEKVAGATKNPA
jgi:hypothetical protein